MIFFSQLKSKLSFDTKVKRLGPDIPFTHWKLHFKYSANKLCQKKFNFFGLDSEFRPGAYAINTDKISIGNNVVIRPNTMLFADERSDNLSICIQDNVLIGSGVHMYVSNHIYSNKSIKIINQGSSLPLTITIEEGAWIGANAIILPGVTIGKNAVVGAGSIVTKSVPPGSVVAGNPARTISQQR